MSTPDLTSLLQRLAAAEAQIAELKRMRRMRVVSPVLLVATLAIAVVCVAPPALRAENGTLGGHTIEAPFSVMAHGTVIFQVKESQGGDQRQALLYNHHGDVVAAMVSDEEKGMVAVGDGNTDATHPGGLKAAIAIDPRGSGTLEIRDDQNKSIAVIKKGPNSQGLAIFRPGTGKVAFDALASDSVAKVSVRDTDEQASGIAVTHGASLELNDAAGQPFAAFNTGEDPSQEGGSPSQGKGRGLFIFNDKGEVRARSSVDSNGNGFIVVNGSDGSEGLLGMRLAGTGSELILAGPHKTIGAELTSSDSAGLYLYNTSGVPFSELNANEHGGRFWLGDTAGGGMIEAGVTEGGRGYLRAGPRIGGPVELTGLPFAVLGKK